MDKKNQPKQIPNLPGVYFFKNLKEKIIYIGKATNLKSRIKSYFLKNQRSLKIQSLLKEAVSIDWKIANSETEALIKESELIKKYRPKYNVLMRDDKQYFYVAFSKEIYPKIYLTHQTIKGPEYIGPFTDGVAIKSVLKMLRRVFPYCTCKKTHKNLCLNSRIERCLGYCCLQIQNSKIKNQNDNPKFKIYKKNISSIKKILSGKNQSLLKDLKREMKKFSRGQKYEKAGTICDQIRSLERIFEHKEIISRDIISENIKALSSMESLLKTGEIKRIESYDVANIQGKYAYGSMAVFVDGAPAKDLYRIFKIKTISGPNDVAMLKEVISRRFKHTEWKHPDVILVDGGKQQLKAIPGHIPLPINPKIIALTKNPHHHGDHIYIFGKEKPLPLDALPLPLKNLLLHLDSEAHRFAIRHYRHSHRKMLRSK